MKKLMVISVVFALVAGAAFAQPAVGGQFKAGATLIQGTNNDGEDAVSGGRYPGNGTEGFLNLRAGDGDMGAMARFFARIQGDYHSADGAFAFAWWKPMDMLRIQFGHNPDADWGTAQITGWGFNSEAQDYVAVDNDSGNWGYDDMANSVKAARSYGFYGGFKSPHALAFSLTPAPGVGVNLGIPFGNETTIAGDQFLKLHFQFYYTIEDIGKINLTYQGAGLGKYQDDDGEDAYDFKGADLFLSFYLMAIDGLGVDIGVGMSLPGTAGGEAIDFDTQTTPVKIGLGVAYGAGDFGVKARFGVGLGGVVIGGDEPIQGTNLAFHILPYYKMEKLSIYLNAGIGLMFLDEAQLLTNGHDPMRVTDEDSPDFDEITNQYYKEKEFDSYFSWFVNPYVRIPAGGATVFAGVKIYSKAGEFGMDKKGKADLDTARIHWDIPVGINFYF